MNLFTYPITLGEAWLAGVRRNWPGILLSIVVAIASTFIADARGGPAKMLRVALLLPVVMALTLAVRWRSKSAERQRNDPLLPPFLIGFVLLVQKFH